MNDVVKLSDWKLVLVVDGSGGDPVRRRIGQNRRQDRWKRWDDVLPTLQVSHSTRRLKKWKSVTEHVFEHVAQSMIKNFPRQRSGGLVVSMLDFYFNNPS